MNSQFSVGTHKSFSNLRFLRLTFSEISSGLIKNKWLQVSLQRQKYSYETDHKKYPCKNIIIYVWSKTDRIKNAML